VFLPHHFGSVQGGEYFVTLTYIQQGLDAARQINDPVRIYNLLFYASWLALAQGDYQRSHDLLDESLHLMRAGNDLNLTAAALWRLGHLCWLERRSPQSLAAFQESLTVRRSPVFGYAHPLSSIGTAGPRCRRGPGARRAGCASLCRGLGKR
jgi:hypothetical protein